MNVDVGLTVTFFNNATNGLRSLGGDVKRVGDNAQATANRLKAIQVVIAGILLDKTLEWGKALVVASAAMQNLDIRLAAFAGGVQKAHQVYGKLSEEFAATPFKIDTIIASWIKLRSAMTSNANTTSVLEAIVNDVGALGGKDENIDNLAAAFQRIFATGQASAREYKTILQQTGLTLTDLAKAAGQTATAFQQNLKNGFVGAQTFIDAFVKASHERFGFFASDLKNSVGGAFSLLSNTFDRAMSDLGERTNVNAHITLFFQNLADAITKTMGAISQKDIDHFFEWLQKMEPLITKTVIGIGRLALVVLQLAGVVGSLLSLMSPEMIEWGVIGFMLFGKKGAAALALLNGTVTKMSSVSGDVVAAQNNLQQKAAANGQSTFGALYNHYTSQGGLTSMLAPERATLDLFYAKIFGAWKAGGDTVRPLVDKLANITGLNNSSKSLFGDPKQLASMEASIKKMMDDFGKGGLGGKGQAGDLTGAFLQALEQANALTQQLQDNLDGVQSHVRSLNFKTAGDELGASIEALTQEGIGVQKSIDGAIKSEATLKVHTAANLAIVAQLREEKERINKAIDEAIAKEKEVYAIQQRQFVLQQNIAQMQNNFSASLLNIQNKAQGQGMWAQMLLGTDGGAAVLDFMGQEETLKESIANIDSQLLALELQLRDVQADPVKVAAIHATENSLNNLRTSTSQALSSLSVEGQLQVKLWKDFGHVIEDDVANGITGLLQGTMTLGDAARKVFADMISMAIKYLVQLLAIKAVGLLGFANGGIMPGGVAAFANGGPLQPGGNVKAFANGDILTGPTLFGLAGEAGTEAIMPLTRIGGKLGVRAEGGGGDTHIHIHAIDTQTGAEFLMKNMDTISSGIEQRRRLNRGVKS